MGSERPMPQPDETLTGGQRISAHHLAEIVQAGARGAEDALDNLPPAQGATPSQTETTLLARVAEIQLAIRREASQRLNALQADLAARRAAFGEQTYAGRLRAADDAMRALLAGGGAGLTRLVHDALRAKREYAYFNHINRRHADPKLESWQFILLFLMVPLVLESLLNGSFFAEASDFGLVGGAATAVIISCLNVALGFILGYGPSRYVQHVRATHLLWALPCFAGLVVAILLFNLAVGHYRELLMLSPDAASSRLLPRLRADPWAVNDLKSIALVLIGCIVALLAALKGYAAFGSYPGHASAYRRWLEARAEVEAEQTSLDAALLPELSRLRSEIDGLQQDCRAELDRLQIAKAQADEARDVFISRLAQLRAAKDGALMQYREANLKVRTEPPPAYFGQALQAPGLDQTAEPAEYAPLRLAIADFERQLAELPALVEAKLRDQLASLRGIDLPDAIARLRAQAMADGEAAFAADEAQRRAMAAEFGKASPRTDPAP